MRHILIALIIAGLHACTGRPDIPENQALTVVYPASVRKEPAEHGQVLVQVTPGEHLKDLYRVSPYVASIYLKDTLRQEPWLYIQTASGTEGWVNGGALAPYNHDDAIAKRQWVIRKRFEAWFGPDLTRRWQGWLQEQGYASDTAFARTILQGFQLRDTLNLLAERNVMRNPGMANLDLFWLEEAMPGFVLQRLGSAPVFHLFADIRYLQGKAQDTPGLQDDWFAAAYLTAFPTDSIESMLPAWVFPITTTSSYSNLGAGRHLQTLQAIDTALRSGNALEAELLNLKDKVLADIMDSDRQYWQPKDKILQEMQAVLSADLSCLTRRDRLALEARLKMFEQPEKNNLTINLRSGR
ncbi:MAG: SH3 domain-containing protein [Bacteroidetes bacterium]|nr:MAG: SH3 domain-containing protein [Bacteroidota bacterium]